MGLKPKSFKKGNMMSTNEEMVVRNQVRAITECSERNPIAQKIIDADCTYQVGKFMLSYLPCPLPSLFTVRFTAPEDYAAGNVIVVKGKGLPVRTPGMVAATSDIFKAGAVIHCDIDLDRELAFFWQGGGNGTAPGVLPNQSTEEQFAGFYDIEGSKVYCKTFVNLVVGNFLANTAYNFPHNIPNFNKTINKIFLLKSWIDSGHIWFVPNETNIRVHCHVATGYMTESQLTLYYTCTDR